MVENIFENAKAIYNYQNDFMALREDCDYFNDYFMKLILTNNLDEDYYINHPILKNNEIKKINDYISFGDYPKELYPLTDKLYNYIGPENMWICFLNLKTVKVTRSKKYKISKFNFSPKAFSGEYFSEQNEIRYYNEDTLPHEFMHMASTAREKNNYDLYYSGFRFDYKDKILQRGINEGYTELLARRIYFNENYYSDSLYNPIVYILRIFELLYPDYKYMEKDYFWANHKSPMNIFRRYGSVEEFFKLSRYLDYFAVTNSINNEDIKTFEFIEKIIRRTYDDEKIIRSMEIKNEYLSNEKKASGKLFSLYKKRQ